MLLNEILGCDQRFIELGYEKANMLLRAMEKSCYDSCCTRYHESGLAYWGDMAFRDRYHNICYNIAYILDKENEMANSIRPEKYIMDQLINLNMNIINQIGFMSCEELQPQSYAIIRANINERRDIKINVKTSSMYKCNRCGGKCTYEPIQLRRMDEDINVRITCINCGNMWII